jgi:pimeloyl-ACP methyl ester carboxylesterase
MERLDVTFDSAGDKCAAWLYLPDGDGPHPVVVMGHGLGAIRDMGLAKYAERFRDAGYAALVFDYRYFGASGGEPRQLLDIKAQRADWKAAIAYARSRPDLDPDRVVAWGSSFGGGHVIATAADDPRLAAAIAQCPFTDGVASSLAMHPLAVLRLTGRAIADVASKVVGRGPVYAATAGKPGSAAFMTAPDAEPGYLALLPDDEVPFVNEIAARLVFHVMTERPGRKAKRIAAPILFCICDPDSVAPAGPTHRYAEQAPRGEVKEYGNGHFGIYVGDGFERAVADQLDFLHRHVPVVA